MNQAIKQMSTEADQLESKARELRAAIQIRIRNCNHVWGPTRYTPTVREAYTDPGDVPGTMGVDWRGPTHVPRQETPKWTRKCEECGTTEETTRMKEKIERVPQFGT